MITIMVIIVSTTVEAMWVSWIERDDLLVSLWILSILIIIILSHLIIK